MSASRKRSKRRDRRKAKQTGYARAPKQMGAHVGHGTSGSPGGPRRVSRVQRRRPILVETAPDAPPPSPHRATATIGEIVRAKTEAGTKAPTESDDVALLLAANVKLRQELAVLRGETTDRVTILAILRASPIEPQVKEKGADIEINNGFSRVTIGFDEAGVLRQVDGQTTTLGPPAPAGVGYGGGW